MSIRRVLAVMIFLLLSTSAFAGEGEGRWTFQVGTGNAYSFPMWMKIQQDGQKDIELWGRYNTNAFSTQAIYYNFRLGYWVDGKAWEFESLHHKVYLKNKPDDVKTFNISHGYNMNMVSRAWESGWFIYRLGGGFVMAHPETEIRGHKKEDDGGINGFYISGLAVQAAVEKRFYVWNDLFLSLEAKLTAADAVVPVYGGEAHVPNVAIHGIGSVGYKF